MPCARKQRRRWQQVVGLLLLLAGYASLAVSADTASEWLLLRGRGFVLLFVGFAVAIVSPVAALLRGP